MVQWRGVVAATVTPMDPDGSGVDLAALSPYCDFLVGKGVQGVFVCGTTGEGPLLTLDERKAVAECVVRRIRGKAWTIVHTGSLSTAQALDLTLHARRIGADAAGVVLPYFYGLDDRAVADHFIRIARAVPGFPIFLYNIPSCTGNNLSPDALERILDASDNIAGIKTSATDLFQLQEYVRILGPEKSVFIGCDRLDLAALALGANGIVSGNASAFPEPFLQLFKKVETGAWKAAREQQAFNYRLATILKDGRYPAVYKKGLALRGIPVGGVRSPHRELTPEESESLETSLRDIGLVP